jgi:hypothetical protein
MKAANQEVEGFEASWAVLVDEMVAAGLEGWQSDPVTRTAFHGWKNGPYVIRRHASTTFADTSQNARIQRSSAALPVLRI